MGILKKIALYEFFKNLYNKLFRSKPVDETQPERVNNTPVRRGSVDRTTKNL